MSLPLDRLMFCLSAAVEREALGVAVVAVVVESYPPAHGFPLVRYPS